MSEYQYYEFQAIDRPLSERELQALRALSSRARITATGFINDYSWGDFRGSVDGLMAKCFDAFVYLANWGTRRFMLRLPSRFIDLKTAELYCGGKAAKASDENIILDFWSTDEESGGEWIAGEGWLAYLIPVRLELLHGDIRCLYLGWLLSAQAGKVAKDAIEPPVPPGLGELSSALKRFAEFLRIDTSLIDVAAERSVALDNNGAAHKDLAAWIGSLPESDKNNFLIRLFGGQDRHLDEEILGRFQREQKPYLEGKALATGGRTAAQLLAAAEQRAKEKKRQAAEKEAREREQREREQAVARAKYLDEFAKRAMEAWHQVDRLIDTKRQKDYDEAIKVLIDLRDLGVRKGQTQYFKERLQQLRERHSNKPSLGRRMDAANLAVNSG